MKKLFNISRYLIILLQIAYFLRFQIITWLFLLSFPFIAYFLAPSMLSGLFDLAVRGPSNTGVKENYRYLALFTFLTLTLAWTAMITTKLTICYGAQRFVASEDTEKILKRIRDYKHYHLVMCGLAFLACVPLFTFVFRNQDGSQLLYVSASFLSGAMVFIIGLFGVDWIQRRLNYRQDAENLNGFFFPFPARFLIKAN
jgi:hypothetical protein